PRRQANRPPRPGRATHALPRHDPRATATPTPSTFPLFLEPHDLRTGEHPQPSHAILRLHTSITARPQQTPRRHYHELGSIECRPHHYAHGSISPPDWTPDDSERFETRAHPAHRLLTVTRGEQLQRVPMAGQKLAPIRRVHPRQAFEMTRVITQPGER